ncbi:uncharacterized protein DSM5745_10814 [Aspergillus mulundensis]|uniref:Uncharacterized protein n=1 Tax=Aspergillus mulundensis TaxID=1810919 RepID=A0A3D8QES7_9EURO|nr:hypothetical protein DSM5745_10814 [Aspergillus mulundensis]RDW60356.1 hypothetical protein DSM5745_10814 [Aspergillus mulundensis]
MFMEILEDTRREEARSLVPPDQNDAPDVLEHRPPFSEAQLDPEVQTADNQVIDDWIETIEPGVLDQNMDMRRPRTASPSHRSDRTNGSVEEIMEEVEVIPDSEITHQDALFLIEEAEAEAAAVTDAVQDSFFDADEVNNAELTDADEVNDADKVNDAEANTSGDASTPALVDAMDITDASGTIEMIEDTNVMETDAAEDAVEDAVEDAAPDTVEDAAPDAELSETPFGPGTMLPPNWVRREDIDESEEVPQQRCTFTLPSFHLMLGLWSLKYNITQSQYKALVEVLQLLDDVSLIASLPASLGQLKKNTKGQFRSIPLRRVKVPVVSAKLQTLSAPDKRRALDASTWMYFIDPIPLISSLVKSPSFMQQIHQGMAEFVDVPTELWHGVAWGSSVRTTSGQFARYPGPVGDRAAALPSDFVWYRCQKLNCACTSDSRTHIGRINCVGINHTSYITEVRSGDIVLQLQVLLKSSEVPSTLALTARRSGSPIDLMELLIHEDKHVLIAEHQLLSHEPRVTLDYGYQNPLSQPIASPAGHFIVRRILDKEHKLRALYLSSPHRGEQEIKVYGRQHLIDSFDSSTPPISLPYQMFMDGFGLYRTTYKSLMGIYLIFAGMTVDERAKLHNVFAITLGPYGTNFRDVIKNLIALGKLDAGIEVMHDGAMRKVFAFVLAFLGDMPQQNVNCGLLGPTAHVSCRFCLVDESSRHNLDINLVKLGRYHNQTSLLHQLAHQKTGREKSEFCRKYGLASLPSPLFKIAPAQILERFFPIDVCHADGAGLSQMVHILLLEHVLTEYGRTRYLAVLQRFPFPVGWQRLQSPLTHMKSYRLQEHVRASIVAPLLLRCYMERHWISDAFYEALCELFRERQDDPKDIITSVFAAVARSNSAIQQRSMKSKDRSQLEHIIKQARSGVQHIAEAAAIAAEEITPYQSRSRSRSQSVAVTASDWETTPASSQSSQTSLASGRPIETKKSRGIRALQQRPNMHIGLHYPAQSAEYATPWNNNVLAGEHKNKVFKNRVRYTNHREPERDLLSNEYLPISVQLSLNGAIEDNNIPTPELQNLAQRCPMVFKAMWPLGFGLSEEDRDNEEEGLGYFGLVLSPNPLSYKDISLSFAVPGSKVQAQMGIPKQLHQASELHWFIDSICSAYHAEYKFPPFMEIPNNAQWYRRVAMSTQ